MPPFLIRYFLQRCFLLLRVYISSQDFLKSFQFFFYVINIIFVLISLLQQSFVSFVFSWSYVLFSFASDLPVDFSFVMFWKVLLCLYYLVHACYLLSLCTFANIFWFISSTCLLSLVCNCIFRSFLFQRVLVYFPSSLISLVLTVSLFVLLSSFPIQILRFLFELPRRINIL